MNRSSFFAGLFTGLLIVLVSCTYFAPKKAALETKVAGRIPEITQAASIANQRAKDELSRVTSRLGAVEVPTNNAPVSVTKTNFTEIAMGVGRASEAVDLAGEFLQRDQALVGIPTIDQTETVNKLLGENAILKAEAVYTEKYRQSQEESWVGKIKDLNTKLQDYGAKYEQERNEKITRWLKWGSIIFALIAIPIALTVFFPPFAGFIIGIFPSLTKIFGVPLKVGSGMVRAVGDMRYSLDNQIQLEANPGAAAVTYTATQVKAMLDAHLNEHLDDPKAQAVVEHLRQVNNA